MASLDSTMTLSLELDAEGRELLEQLKAFPTSELREVLRLFVAGGLATEPLVKAVAADRDRLLVEVELLRGERDRAVAQLVEATR